MINALSTYYDAGQKAGRATRQRDAALSRHWHEWVRKASRLEHSSEDTVAAQREYERGYSDGFGLTYQ